MTTYTIQGFKINVTETDKHTQAETNWFVSSAEASTLTYVLENNARSFSYKVESTSNGLWFASTTLKGDTPFHTYIDGKAIEDAFPIDARQNLIGQHSHDIEGVYVGFVSDNSKWVDYIFQLGGPEIPIGATPDDFIPYFYGGDNRDKVATGPYAPGMPINYNSFTHVTVTEDDVFHGDNTKNVIHSGLGDDIINGKNGDDRLFGGVGDDTLNGGDGDDRLLGGRGNDNLDGEDGDDIMYGHRGDDTLTSYGGNNLMFGGRDNDTLTVNTYGAKTSSMLHGGTGNDTLRIANSRHENKLFGGNGDDTLTGNSGVNYSLFGGNGDDKLFSRGSKDLVRGGNDDDYLTGRLKGASGDNTFYGDLGNDTLLGGFGEDTLNGGWGRDHLNGGRDDDTLDGGAGSDKIIGASGNDILTGGVGSDTFVYLDSQSHTENDTITDFENGIDMIEIKGSRTFDELTITAEGSDTVILWGHMMTITLENTALSNIGVDDFILS